MELSKRTDGIFCAYQKKIKTYFRSGAYFSCEVNLSNKYEKRPTLILVHGSGGISSEIELWKRVALSCGWHVFIPDHFSSRGIEKLSLDGTDQIICTPMDVAEDLKVLISEISQMDKVGSISLVGFSLGATAAMLANDSDLHLVQAYYPTLRPLPERMRTLRTDNLEIVVGTNDDLTPLQDVQFLKDALKKDFKLTIMKDLYHSFMRPGSEIDARVFPIRLSEKHKDKIVSDEEYRRVFLTDDFFDVPRPWPRVKLKGDSEVIRNRITQFFGIDQIESFTKEFNL